MRRLIVASIAALATTLALGLIMAAPGGSLPPTPWTGSWVVPASQTAGAGDQTIALTQTGSSISGTFSYCGGGTFTGAVSADGSTWTGESFHPAGVPGCSGTGHVRFTVTMAADGRSFSGSGVTDFGNGFPFNATYAGGGVEPRETPAIQRPVCAGGPWSGLWTTRRQGGRFSFSQDGQRLAGIILDTPETHTATISGDTARGTYRLPDGSGDFTLVMAPDGRSFRWSGTLFNGRPDEPFTSSFVGCQTGLPAVDLAKSIPNPQTLRGGPTTIVAPGTISVTSLRRSKCVLVRVASARPARILTTIFSGRRSVRVFGQRRVVFQAPGRRTVCIRVPFRAHTFDVRTRLRIALGYQVGARRRAEEPRTPVTIRNIRLRP